MTSRPFLLSSSTIICGSGISVDAPSLLPDGDRLATTLFDLVVQAGPHVFDSRAIERVRRQLRRKRGGSWADLRLELLFEMLAEDLDPRTLVLVYGLLAAAEPNANHLGLLLARPLAILTTNQDVLFEKAAAYVGAPSTHLVHLHGRCDRPRTIVTLISQYLRGLSRGARRRLTTAVHGVDVIVVGYSGRDRDVMPALLRADPGRVLWLDHAGGGASSSPELRELTRALGSRLVRRTVSTRQWILRQLSVDDRRRVQQIVGGLTSGAPSLRPGTRDAFAALGDTERNLALARLLRHVGLHREARAGLERLARRSGDPRIKLALAAILGEMGELAAACRRYEAVTRDHSLDADLRCSALLGLVQSLRSSSRFDRAERRLDDLDTVAASLPARSARAERIRGWAASQRAGLLRMGSDDEVGAIRRYVQAEQHFRRANSIDGLVDVLTYRSDSWRSVGDYKRALIDLRRALTDAELFSHSFSKPWPAFYHGLVLCSGGDVAGGLRELARAERLFRYAGTAPNRNGQAWCLVMMANFQREVDLSAAALSLRRARRVISRYGALMAFGEARARWEAAELARSYGNSTLVRTRLRRFREFVLTIDKAPRYLETHALAIEAELARDEGASDAGVLLAAVRRDYEALGSIACAARIAVSEWLVVGGRPPVDLVRLCRAEGYGLELQQLRTPSAGYYPLHVI